tara:strand:+ start:39 stop:1001 length:963 start_codon:yes stop_codon:yes gene_type:complete
MRTQTQRRERRNRKARQRRYTRKKTKNALERAFNYPLLIVFDIDETLIQFLNKNAYKYIESMDDVMRRDLDNNIKYRDIAEKRQFILFRPGLEGFFEYVKKHNKYIKIALWTYSENEYAKNIKEILMDEYDLNEDMFLFRWGVEDMFEDDYRIDYPKDLELIWNDEKRHKLQEDYDSSGENDGKIFGGTYNKFNTIFLDDRYGNVSHEKNRRNSILVKGFEPFGHTKTREPMTNELLKNAKKDDMLVKLIEILEKLKTDYKNCSEDECAEAHDMEYIFEPKKVVRKGFSKYLKEHMGDVELITLGDVKNAYSTQKGGIRK